MRPRPTLADPRLFQIASLAGLLLYGVAGLDLEVRLATALLILATAFATQAAACRWVGIRFDPRSPLISALSLCLLLRSSSTALAAGGAALAIGSKFTLRHAGKHLFNPTNFALVTLLLVSDRVWVSPGQWGSAAFFGFLLACAGGLVIRRSRRSDVTLAFLAAYAGGLFGRALWLGDPLAIPLHQLESGALLIFAFFMISDPKTTPDSRPGRLLFALLVAALALAVRFVLFRPNDLLWALAIAAPAVPLLDRQLPGHRYEWPRRAERERSLPLPPPVVQTPLAPSKGAPPMRHLPLCLASLLLAAPALPFCGFYVGRADTRLYNQASQVVLVRDGDRTVVTMAADYKGELDEFALVVPVPTFIEREQIHVADRAILAHLDAYTAPRLVEYFDEDPCRPVVYEMAVRAQAPTAGGADQDRRARSLGVTIEASYSVGEYDILILSARESSGLATWLEENGYRLPPGAAPVLRSYLDQGMRFFVARVDLTEQAALGFTTLRPLSVAYETPRFMLPIRLGTVNADGPQELFVYALGRNGRIETTNYRTVKLPTGLELPEYVEEEFAEFYRDMFAHQVEREDGRAVFLEYAWDMGWCDPCAADPLSPEELRELGVFWLDAADRRGPARNVFVSRLHLRYDREHFPEDLVFQETGDRTNFQGRYVLRHPFTGSADCPAAAGYRDEVAKRQERQAQELASSTGWDVGEIRRKMGLAGDAAAATVPWWKRLWGG